MKKSVILLFLICAFLKTFNSSAQQDIFLCGGNIGFEDVGYEGRWWDYITIDTINYHHNIWQTGIPQKTIFDSTHYLSLPKAIVTDTLNAYPANDTSAFTLKLHGQSWGGWSLLSLTFFYQIDIDSTSIAKFEFSADSGVSWTNLFDSDYAINVNSVAYIMGMEVSNSFNFSPAGWHGVVVNSIDATQYAINDSMLFRFTFISGNVTTPHDGWMIDNFQILYCPMGVPTVKNDAARIWPNPCFDEVNVESTVMIKSVVIQDVLGRNVLKKDCNDNKACIPVSDLSPGVYFLRVNDEGFRKFIKE